MTTLMSVDQYEARLGRPLSGTRRDQAEAFLADASDEVRRIARPHLDGAGPDEVSGTIRLVIFSMVTRARTNPRGLDSERIGDWQGGGMSPVYATDEEKDLIEDDAGVEHEPAVREIPLTGEMPQRLLDEAANVPYTYLGGF